MRNFLTTHYFGEIMNFQMHQITDIVKALMNMAST